METDLKAALKDVSQNRDAVIDKLVEFSGTDMLLFWGENKDLIERQQKLWQPILDWAQQTMDMEFKTTSGIDVPEQDKETGVRMRAFLNSLSDKELLAFFKAALDMRSVLLAAALVKGRLTAEQAFEAAFVEELWQSENWGVVEEAQQRRDELKAELVEIEKFLKSA